MRLGIRVALSVISQSSIELSRVINLKSWYPRELMRPPMNTPISYILPIKSSAVDGLNELTDYLGRLQRFSPRPEIIVVDGSPAQIFLQHAECWTHIARHMKPNKVPCLNGKVAGVLTGLAAASHERVIVADDDVRYDHWSLARTIAALDHADIVRPQNYFMPNTWHTLLDSGRSLINRVTGGDWPGTIALRRSFLRDGYSGDVLFENLELVRTVCALGGKELVAYDIFVSRRPPSAGRFLSQRIRQAYDEFARPFRMVCALSILPLCAAAIMLREWSPLTVTIIAIILAAEVGRWRGGGRRYFPVSASFAAPLWVLERGVCVWLALAARLCRGGIYYSDSVIRVAATPKRVLARRRA
jgi:hypothetical protein